MTVAQTKAARRRAKSFLKDGPIGQTRFHVPSVEKQQRREMKLREKAKMITSRKGKKK